MSEKDCLVASKTSLKFVKINFNESYWCPLDAEIPISYFYELEFCFIFEQFPYASNWWNTEYECQFSQLLGYF